MYHANTEGTKKKRLLHLRKANQVEADHVIKRLTELAPSALLGEQHFFIGWGLHRLQKLSNIVAKISYFI